MQLEVEVEGVVLNLLLPLLQLLLPFHLILLFLNIFPILLNICLFVTYSDDVLMASSCPTSSNSAPARRRAARGMGGWSLTTHSTQPYHQVRALTLL